ncbi:hypothetical protein ADLP2_092 [Acinetobacter phage vB_AbaM_DLP2]|nr:hypothetical protein ADLP2_092 [Acinetobacter phage vB_AbaM_DLP2]
MAPLFLSKNISRDISKTIKQLKHLISAHSAGCAAAILYRTADIIRAVNR